MTDPSDALFSPPQVRPVRQRLYQLPTRAACYWLNTSEGSEYKAAKDYFRSSGFGHCYPSVVEEDLTASLRSSIRGHC